MSNLDANLLFALDALLQEVSVTRAGERLGVSQPTMSASLARLRRHFHDELLYRSGNTYKLTPLAIQLSGRTGIAVNDVRKISALQPTFDPTTLEREFVFACSDYVAAVVGPPLTAMLAAVAPRVWVNLQQGHSSIHDDVEDRLRGVDGLLMPHGFVPDLPRVDLYRDEWVCMVSVTNTSVGAELGMDDLRRLPWVANFGGPATTTAMQSLHQLGVAVRAEVVVNAFLLVPLFVAGTDRIALVPRRLASVLALDGVRMLACPFDAGAIALALWWHPDFERDVEHAWLRGLMGEVARLLTNPA